ncbi:hypothetical protein RN001_010790 [Aquatica leii]|uniref:Multifunctional fusion protein n=1 Tax=Aquatica leii TaxID=1421715 RepID=A0AAN7PV91_9COLE|nr:hypothetical protein RN001_010790 [Aquatica leii]
MLSAYKLTLKSNLQRNLVRCVGSVVSREIMEESCVKNEVILDYLEGSNERCKIKEQLKCMEGTIEDIPIVVGHKEFTTQDCRYQVLPHNHKHKLAKYYYATEDIIKQAIKVATEAQREWDRTPLCERVKIFQKAADLMATKYRFELNAATMLGQSKTVIQAEIDSSAELIDFFRFNAHFLQKASQYQPLSEDSSTVLNSIRYRGFDGFVAAITPFNFTAIGGNLAYTPVLMGNAVLWKPSDTAVLSNWIVFKICREAGVPPGVVNFVPCDGPVFGNAITASNHLAGINFTGSVPTFNTLWQLVGKNLKNYVNYPRLIGECGGKNYHFIHPSADVDTVIACTVRAAFEYCGQKCSACSRMYVPESLWCTIKSGMIEACKKLKIGNVCEFDTFMGAVIDEKAFKRMKGYLQHGQKQPNCTLVGGLADSSCGYFVDPTIIEVQDPCDKLMTEEVFGPILAVYVYKDCEVDTILNTIGSSTPYALTGAIFGQDEKFLKYALEVLKMTAGNFYINDKCTGSVVGQQPFGGARMSGTNDKAGGPYFILRWGNPQSIKETFTPLTDICYPYMTSN